MDISNNQYDITLRDTVRIIFKYKWVILNIFLITVLSTYVGMELKTPTYKSEVKMLVSAKKQIESNYYRDLLDFRQSNIALTQSEIVLSRPVLQRAMEALNLQNRPLDYEKQFASNIRLQMMDLMRQMHDAYVSVYNFILGPKPVEQPNLAIENFRKLKENIEIESVKDTDIFIISVEDYDPIAAMTIANVVSRSYIIFDLEQQLAELELKFGYKHLAVTQLKDMINKLTYNLTAERQSTSELIGPASVKIIDQANVPTGPTGKPKVFIYAIALPLGLFMGVVLAFVFEYIDQTFKSPREVERVLETPVLGSLPKRKFMEAELIHNLDGKGLYAKAYKDLSDQMYLVMTDDDIKTILFATAEAKNDDAHVMANICLNLAHNGNKVLCIDANFRKPSIHKILKLDNEIGLADIITDKTELDEAVQEYNDDLFVLSAGNTQLNPITLLGSHKLRTLLELVNQRYDMIFVCTSNIAENKDAAILSRVINDLIIILIESYSRQQSVQTALMPILRNETRLTGAILTERVFVIPKPIYNRI